MSSPLSGLSPARVWYYFEQLNAIPRASKNESRATEFVASFGKTHGLRTEVDAVGNVLIAKPAGAQCNNQKASVALQSHLDMVHQKNAATVFDFDRDGIQMTVENGWVKAVGTTLGADNGLGVAISLALLESNDPLLPALEALFTVDEETGMTGALALQPGWLSANQLINIDTEDEHEITVGCAGGADVSVRAHFEVTPAAPTETTLELSVAGLTGGHSGMDIHLGRGNANKLCVRVLRAAAAVAPIRLQSFSGGTLRNAIPREATAVVLLPSDALSAVRSAMETELATLHHEYRLTDGALKGAIKPSQTAGAALTAADTQKLIALITGCPSGIVRMSAAVSGLVQTSNNLAVVELKEGRAEVKCLARSAVNSERDAVGNEILTLANALGFGGEVGNSYPGWEPLPESPLASAYAEVYAQLFGSTPEAKACHAGLECGIIGRHYPAMQMISIGPNITGAHSPDEKAEVASVERFWLAINAVLRRLGD